MQVAALALPAVALPAAMLSSDTVLADALYGMSVKILGLFKEIGSKVIVPIKDGVWHKVRDPLRIEVMNSYMREKERYKMRYIVEQVIGKIKNAYGRCEGTKKLELAIKYVWTKFIAYNYCILKALKNFWRWFGCIFNVVSGIKSPSLVY